MKVKHLTLCTLLATSFAHAGLSGADLEAANAYFEANTDVVKYAPWIKESVLNAPTLVEANYMLKGNSYYNPTTNQNIYVNQINGNFQMKKTVIATALVMAGVSGATHARTFNSYELSHISTIRGELAYQYQAYIQNGDLAAVQLLDGQVSTFSPGYDLNTLRTLPKADRKVQDMASFKDVQSNIDKANATDLGASKYVEAKHTKATSPVAPVNHDTTDRKNAISHHVDDSSMIANTITANSSAAIVVAPPAYVAPTPSPVAPVQYKTPADYVTVNTAAPTAPVPSTSGQLYAPANTTTTTVAAPVDNSAAINAGVSQVIVDRAKAAKDFAMSKANTVGGKATAAALIANPNGIGVATHTFTILPAATPDKQVVAMSALTPATPAAPVVTNPKPYDNNNSMAIANIKGGKATAAANTIVTPPKLANAAPVPYVQPAIKAPATPATISAAPAPVGDVIVHEDHHQKLVVLALDGNVQVDGNASTTTTVAKTITFTPGTAPAGKAPSKPVDDTLPPITKANTMDQGHNDPTGTPYTMSINTNAKVVAPQASQIGQVVNPTKPAPQTKVVIHDVQDPDKVVIIQKPDVKVSTAVVQAANAPVIVSTTPHNVPTPTTTKAPVAQANSVNTTAPVLNVAPVTTTQAAQPNAQPTVQPNVAPTVTPVATAKPTAKPAVTPAVATKPAKPGSNTPVKTPVAAPVKPLGSKPGVSTVKPTKAPVGAYVQQQAAMNQAITNANSQASQHVAAQQQAQYATQSSVADLEQSTNSKFASMDKRIKADRKHASQGIANVAAMANIPQVNADQDWSVGAGVGAFDGEAGVAVGASARVNSHTTVKFTVGAGSTGGATVGAGVAIGY